MIALPSSIHRFLALLDQHEISAWIVGGYVRDSLLGRQTHDIDIASSASWQVIEELCAQEHIPTIRTGITHGTITAKIENQFVEITTFRSEGAYSDKRHPDEVFPVSTIEEDLARRDITINALAFHPLRGIIDPYCGRQDLENGVIRCVGNPNERLQEDPLRILRILRFASTLAFKIEEQTCLALQRHAHLLQTVSSERIEKEFRLFLMGQKASDVLEAYPHVFTTFIPEIVPSIRFNQKSPYHIYDVFKHTTCALNNSPFDPIVRYAVLFHDLGKPETYYEDETGRGHFPGHPIASERIARSIAKRLCLSRAETEEIAILVRLHDEPIKATLDGVQTCLSQLNEPDLLRRLLNVKRADIKAHAPSCFYELDEVDELEDILDTILKRALPYQISHLCINGDDLIEHGIPEGKQIGESLDYVLQAVISGTLTNEKDAILDFVEKNLK